MCAPTASARLPPLLRTAQKQGGLHQLASAQQSVPISFVCWSRTHAGLLAYGTDRGEIFLYQHAHGRQPERQNAGKHPSGKMPGVKSDNQIACGDWLRDGALALASGSRVRAASARPHVGAAQASWQKLDMPGQTVLTPQLPRSPRAGPRASSPRSSKSASRSH